MQQIHIFTNYLKSSTLYAVNQQPLRIVISKNTKFQDFQKAIQIAWKIYPTNLRLFLYNGVELEEDDIQYIRPNSKIYASLNGEELQLNILFLHYSIKDQLQSNCNASTMVGFNIKTNKEVIIKQINIHQLNESEIEDQFRILQNLKDIIFQTIPIIYDLIIFLDKHKILLVTDFYKFPNLSKLDIQLLSHINIQYIVKQIALTIQMCHSKNIIMKNLKLENIIIVNEETLNIKILDIGQNNSYKVFNGTSIQCFNYYSPELLEKKEFGYSGDIWTLGVIIFYLNFNRFPFDGRTKQNIYNNIINCKFNIDQNTSNTLKDLLNNIFVKNKNMRLTINEILTHPYLQQQNRLNTSFFKFGNNKISIQKINQIESVRRRVHSQRLNSEENITKRSTHIKQKNQGSPIKESNESKYKSHNNSQHKQLSLQPRIRCFSQMLHKYTVKFSTQREF